MADEPLPELDGHTPLAYALTPGMDRIAREGCSGEFLTLPEGYATGSEVANMSVLGCDLDLEYCGRGPLEAVGRGIVLHPDDIAFRLNLVTVENGLLTDFSGGHPPREYAEACVAALNAKLGSDTVCFHAGVSYRNLLVLRDSAMSPKVITEKPDDHQGQPVASFYPRAATPEGGPAARLLARIMREAPAVLRDVLRPSGSAATISGVWPWSGGRAGAIRGLQAKYGVRGAVITAVDVIAGLGRCMGMDVISVPGATGYIDTNYEGKARAAIDALQDHEFVYLHVEAIDEVSHARDLSLKIKTIEQFDARIVQPVLAALDAATQAVVLPDHYVPVRLGKHTRTPVPVAVLAPGAPPDSVRTYNEIAARRGSLGFMAGNQLMDLLLGPQKE